MALTGAGGREVGSYPNALGIVPQYDMDYAKKSKMVE